MSGVAGTKGRFGEAGAGIWVKAAIIAAAVAYAFSPAIRGQYLWDDVEEVKANPALRDLHGLGTIWFAPKGLDYYPLKSTVQWIEWHLWGANAVGYHSVSLGLHLLGALLLWRVLWRLGLRRAWVGGLVFAVHPLCVESVAWMAELKNTLSLPMLLLAFLSYSRTDENGVRPPLPGGVGGLGKPYLASFLWFVASMLCKTSGVMFPVVILLYAWSKRGRVTRRDLRASAPFFAVSIGLGMVTYWLQEHRSIGEVALPIGGAASRAAGAGITAAFYFCKSVLPLRLLPMYPQWPIDPVRFDLFLPWVAIAAAGFWAGRNRSGWGRAVLFGGGFFLLNLLPVLGFVPISVMRFTWAMDHLAYLPLIGLAGLAAAGADGIALRRVRMAAVAGVAIAFAIASHRYSRLFASSLDLWTYQIERHPGVWLGQYNLGVALDMDGRHAEAEGHYLEAVRLNPAYPEAHVNLGSEFWREGRIGEAVAQYEAALRCRRDYPEAENDLCVVLVQAGQAEAAVRHGEIAVRLRPDFAEAYSNLGRAFIALHRYGDALAVLREAVRLRPDYAEAYNNVGAALANMGNLSDAVPQFEAALARDPNLNDARENLRRVQAALARRGGQP